ncbi:bridge-like lipid transfer protein family member 3A isoform X2 [Hemicordylus capensis]|uniref:bridge-like lipid transfer protein family member 3A isoform X2 n=1 Tax=Hemicordylus capensis TaxID=884348 RepID=UPI002303CEE3|nr:bridge-like lipid transfer protein family member 3A isoform X2 [Hemicordylus capensis]
MAGLIKKQILKHLSRFTKNLSPDKINLSTLKGQGQLTNLELDEEVLQNVLDLPTWLAITRVFCNKASIRIQWTKLKTHPICLYLDKVEVEMRTCEEPRPPNGQSPIALASGQSEYGFAEKVVEGMFIVVNSITIKIHSKAFHASFELWQLQGYSVNPNWQQSDLRFTRITDSHRGEVLTFKELTWQTLRIEADATDNGDQDPITTPLRLITNQGRIQISLKRKLKAMMKYAESLSEAMEKSAQQRKCLAPEPVLITPPAPSAQQSWPQSFGSSHKAISQYFEKHDMKESSYHLLISRLDLHICDDSHTRETGASRHGIMGGAMQLTFRRMAFDYYPFHWAGDTCNHWVRYCDAMETREQWAKKLVGEFQNKMGKHDEEMSSKAAGRESPFKKKPDILSSSQENSPEKGVPQASIPPPTLFRCPQPAWNRLRSSCVVVRVDDLDIYQVSTAGQHSKKPSTLLSCRRKLLNLPDQISAIHIEFTEYYFPDNPDFPVPCPNLYLQLNGLTFTLDTLSMLWVNLFCLDLYRSLQHFKAIYKLENSGKQNEHIDVRLDGFMLKLNIPVEKKVVEHRDRPHCLSIRISEMTATNTRHAPHCSCLALQNLFRRFAASEFFHSSYTQFPKFQDSFSLLHTLFLRHAYQVDTKAHKYADFHHSPRKCSAFEDLWSINFIQISLDFEGTKSSRGKPLNFINSFPLCVWACLPKRWEEARMSKLRVSSASSIKIKPSTSFSNHAKHGDLSREEQFWQRSKTEQNFKSIFNTPEAKEVLEEENYSVNNEANDKDMEISADIHILLYSSAEVKVRLNHYQYLMLLRMREVLQTFQEQLLQDTQEITGSALDSITTCMGIMFNNAELALLMHPIPGFVSEPRSVDSDTTSLLESELSPSESREGLATEGRELKLDVGSEKREGSPTKVLEDNGIDNTDIRVTALQDGMLKSQSDGSLAGEEYHSPATVERGPIEEAHEAEETLGADRQRELSNLSPIPHVVLSSPPSVVDPLGGIRVSLNGQEELIPLKNMEIELSSALHITKDATKEALHVTMDLTKEAMSMTKDALSLSKEKMASTMQKMFHPQTKDPAPKPEEGFLTPVGSGGGRMRFFSMKRTASQHSFDTSSLDGSGLEDRLSVDSDGSDGFVMLIDSEPSLDPLVPGHSQILDDGGNLASPMADEEKGSTYINSSRSQSEEESSPQLVSVLVLKMNELNCVIETKRDDLTLALQAMEVSTESLGNISMWHYLQSECTGDPNSERPAATETNQTEPEVCLRFEIGPSAAVHSPLAVQNGFFHLLVHSYHAELLTSSLSSLGYFLEDEVIPEVIPMKIEIVDAKITLKDDSPRIYPTSPGPIPIILAVDNVVIHCKDDGVFFITAAQGEGSSVQTKSQEDLKKQWIPAERISAVDDEIQLKEVPALERELQVTKRALAEANLDKVRLLQEIRKYDPLFQL